MNDTVLLSEDTVISYIMALKRISVVEDMPVWSPNLRSKITIRTADTRYYIDPSITTAIPDAGLNDLLNDLNTMGPLFRILCVRDLRIYAEVFGGVVSHCRNKGNLECDAIIRLRDGGCELTEIKLGGDKLIEDSIKNLETLTDKIDTSEMPAPSSIVTAIGADGLMYRREDGIYIVPTTCLKN